ncbi:Constitutive centromere-associated network cnp3 [Hyphodiscus hymeniophilus]|uniref:CENP-C homolog n=1 Tax=Hyphodiscus hymeniophilus TaxID=353542 RepID=A0A9P6VHC6_9HELO|nr:Constitutive centromere-associated network cnp3 [Hyphodiscus hymeniophilus]
MLEFKEGKKTGLTLPDTGIRDENGLEPMDHVFSSPAKSVARSSRTNGIHTNGDATISSDDMEMGESTVPEPTAVLNARQSMRMPPPRSKSPIKTFLQSPARRNPSLGPTSSPLRGSIVAPKTASVPVPVRRKLDFSTEDLEATVVEESTVTGFPQKRAGSSSSKVVSKLTNGTKPPVLKPSALEDEDEEDDDSGVLNIAQLDDGGDSFQMVNDYEDEEVEQIEENEPVSDPEPEPQPAKKARGRPKRKAKELTPEPEPEAEVDLESEVQDEAEVTSEPVKKAAKGRGKTRKEPRVEEEMDGRPAKRTRRSLEGAEPAPKPVAKGRPAKTKATKAIPAKKSVTAKSKLAAISEVESPDIQRGPPLPRNNRGLFIMRRETPFEGTGFKQSRYGRNSIKPVAYWKNERIEYSEDEAEDGTTKFLVSRIKEVVRKDEVEDTRPKRTYHKPSKKGKKPPASAHTDDDEAEPWEGNPGRIYNEVRQWDPFDEVGAEVAEEEQEVAWSSAAIITKDVAGASFKFAKCLSIPFFGAGMMDVPVGGMKKPKNSRKMQMVFFVYTGRVQVTINGGDPFRISHGGMWQVPRANFYSIFNDGTKPARIFFSQGCEVEEARVEEEE